MFRWLELYINKTCRKELETYYGKGSNIKFKNVSESIKDKTFLFEAVVFFGEKIDVSLMETEFAHVMICDALQSLQILPDNSKVKTLITWDS